MAVKPIPEGFHNVTPYLIVQDVPKLLDFLKQAFTAQEIMRLPAPDGTIAHAEVRVGDSPIMMGESHGDFKPMPGSNYVYVDDTDATYQRALQAGARSLMEPANQFYGDRSASVIDPVGNHWWIATHVEDLQPEELTRRAEAYMKQQQQS